MTNININPIQFGKAVKKGISVNELLIVLYLEDSSKSKKQLQELLNLTDRSIYRYINDLVSKGYVEKHYKSVNIHYFLTPKSDEIWD